MQRPKWHDDERVDRPDLEAVSTLPEAEVRRVMRLLAGTAVGAQHAAVAYNPYATLVKSGIVYEPATNTRITVQTGLIVAMTGRTYGEVMTLAADVILETFCPATDTSNLLLARISSTEIDEEEDTRVFFDSGTGNEVEDDVDTRTASQIEWKVRLTTDTAGIAADEADGWQWVATLANVADVFSTTWHYMLPASEDGGDSSVASLAAAVLGLARQMVAVFGEGNWYSTPDNTLKDDELHADVLYASERLIVGAVASEDARKAGIEEAGSSDALPAISFHALKDSADALLATNMVGRMGPAVAGSADEFEHLIPGPGGWGADLAQDDEAAILVFANRKWALEAKHRSSDGLRVLIYKDKATGTEFLALRSDGRIELLQTAEVEYMLPILPGHLRALEASNGTYPWTYADSGTYGGMVWYPPLHADGHEAALQWQIPLRTGYGGTPAQPPIPAWTVARYLHSVAAFVETTADAAADACRLTMKSSYLNFTSLQWTTPYDIGDDHEEEGEATAVAYREWGAEEAGWRRLYVSDSILAGTDVDQPCIVDLRVADKQVDYSVRIRAARAKYISVLIPGI